MSGLRSFLVFLAAYILSQFFRSFLAVIAPELALELKLDAQALGNLQAWWIAGFVLMQFPVGYALDTIGPRRTVSVTLLAAAAGAVLFATAHSAFALNLALLVTGIGCGAIYMGALYVFGRTQKPEHFAVLSSWLIGIGSLGNLAAASPLAYAAETIGWRGALLGIAAATLAAALLVAVLIRDPPRLVAGGSPRLLAGIAGIMSIRALWPLLPLTGISYAVVLSERGLWAGPFLSDVHGLEPVARGNALLVMAAAMSAGALLYGPLDRLFGTRKWVVAAGSGVTAALFLMLGLAPQPLAGAVASLAAIGAFGMTYGVLMAHGRSFFPAHLLGRGITFMNVLFIGGAGLLQPASGFLMTAMRGNGASAAQAYAMLHGVFGVALLAALAIYLFTPEKRP